jgi:hypothetical protein
MAFPTRDWQGILSYRSQPTEPPHAREIGRVLRYAMLLAACWFLLSGGVVYVVIAVFHYVNGAAQFSTSSLIVSLLVLVLTIVVGFSLFITRPRT